MALLLLAALLLPTAVSADLLAGERLPTSISDRSREAVDLERATIPELQSLLETGTLTSVELVQLYLERIWAYDENGPSLNSVQAINPNALETARELDVERRKSGPRGPLHGIPLLLKDNIDTAEMPTTAGSLALEGSVPPDDAFQVTQLKQAGAIILGKATMVEFANYLADGMPGGYSSLGGQGLNPYDLTESPRGSSSGSGIAAAAGMAAATIGSETSGSIIGPSYANSLVGLKPTVGLVSRDGVVPISASKDTTGPMGRAVVDVATVLGGMTGVDPADPDSPPSANYYQTDYTQFLESDALDGVRVGVIQAVYDELEGEEKDLTDAALDVIESLGAVLVPVVIPSGGASGGAIFPYEFKRDLNAYLAAREGAPIKSLEELVAFNEAHADEALKYGQERAERALAVDLEADRDEYLETAKEILVASRDEGIDAALANNGDPVDVLWFPTDDGRGIAAAAEYPSLVQPIGYDSTSRMSVGMMWVGTAWQEPDLLAYAYAYEQAAQPWRAPSELNPSAFRCPAPSEPRDLVRPLVGACPS